MGGDYGGTRGREPPLNIPGEGGSWLSQASGGLLPLAPLRGVMSEEEGCRRRSPKRCNSVGGPVPRMGRIFHVSEFCRRSDIERGRPSTAQFLIFPSCERRTIQRCDKALPARMQLSPPAASRKQDRSETEAKENGGAAYELPVPNTSRDKDCYVTFVQNGFSNRKKGLQRFQSNEVSSFHRAKGLSVVSCCCTGK